MTWTPERIDALRYRVRRGWRPWWSFPGDQEHEDAARIGLAVVEASPETVERVFSVLAWGSPERPAELQDDDQIARAMAGNPALAAKARAVLAALSGE